MTKKELAQQALQECNSGVTTAHHGGGKGRPFWNPISFQFMYVPAFQFQHIPGTAAYRYCAKDAYGVEHTFVTETCSALLEPIWKDIPEGVVELLVYALDKAGKNKYLVGARTFYKLAPFSDDLPPAARDYKACVADIYEYAFQQIFLQHWLTHGTPDPDYDLNVYPSKMISAIIIAMLDYAKICPERENDAVQIAKNAADYLIGITPMSGSMAGIPPTYQIDFRDNPESRQNLTAADRLDWVMMTYPPKVGAAYLRLETVTKDPRYYDAALKIGEYYRDHVEENGSWYLIRSKSTGKPIAPQYCGTMRAHAPFLMDLYERTGDQVWKQLADNAVRYIEKVMLPAYDWEAQFEDSPCSENYSNLTHYNATALLRYYCKYYANDPERMAIADDLMRFVEDQFVIWKKPSPWNRVHFDTSLWQTPCGMEQYNWHVPIDASTGDISQTFLAMYLAGRGELHLEKAKALADSITRAQQPDGMLPTHWMTEAHKKGEDFWINCMFYAARALSELAEYLDSNNV